MIKYLFTKKNRRHSSITNSCSIDFINIQNNIYSLKSILQIYSDTLHWYSQGWVNISSIFSLMVYKYCWDEHNTKRWQMYAVWVQAFLLVNTGANVFQPCLYIWRHFGKYCLLSIVFIFAHLMDTFSRSEKAPIICKIVSCFRNEMFLQDFRSILKHLLYLFPCYIQPTYLKHFRRHVFVW